MQVRHQTEKRLSIPGSDNSAAVSTGSAQTGHLWAPWQSDSFFVSSYDVFLLSAEGHIVYISDWDRLDIQHALAQQEVY
jgi:hypothetical protein